MEVTAQHVLLSPYRCRDCRERFWVASRNAYYLAGIAFVALLLVGALAWTVGSTTANRATVAVPSAPDPERLADLAKLAEKGDSAAEYEIAMMYANGYGAPKNSTEARKWLALSAGHGNAGAQFELGLALRDGRGAIQDYRGALKWITTAAEAGHGEAQFALGVMYRLGTGTPVDNVKAYTWLNLAAAQGVDGASAVRDSVMTHLSQAEIVMAQAEARRMNEAHAAKAMAGPEAQARCDPHDAGEGPDCKANVDAGR
jgi:TPR repeat protein